MNKIRLGVSMLALMATIIIGLASLPAAATANGGECNCIDGFSKKEGIFGWDPEQNRNHCIPGCSVVTFDDRDP